MPIKFGPLEELRRKMRIARGEEMPEPSLVYQPETGRTYLAPTSVYEYFTGRRRGETADQAKDRQRRAWNMLHTESRGQATGDGFSEQSLGQATGDGFSEQSLGQATGDGFSEQGHELTPEQIRVHNRPRPQLASFLSTRLRNLSDKASDRITKHVENGQNDQPVEQKSESRQPPPSQQPPMGETSGVDNSLAAREAVLRQMIQGMNRGEMPQLPSNVVPAYADAVESDFVRSRDAASDDYQTTVERNIDSVIGPKKRLSQRNIRAQEGRVPGYKPEGLTADEQERVSRRLLGAARGGMVDETSGLNSRLGAYQAAASRDKAKELQKQAEQQKMSDRFQAVQATRAPDAKVESRKLVSQRPGVRTFAEKIAGVQDDPSTPMDESVRYVAKWDDPEAAKQERLIRQAEVRANRERRAGQREQGRGAVMSGRLAAMSGAKPEMTGNATIDQIQQRAYGRQMVANQKAEAIRQQQQAAQFGQALQQARMSDMITGGNATGQLLSYVQAERDRVAQQEAVRSGQAHDLKKIEAQGSVSERLQKGQNEFTSGESEKDRQHRTAQQLAGQTFAAGESEKDRQSRISERLAGQTFAAGESEKDRSSRRGMFDEEMSMKRQQATIEGLRDERDALADIIATQPGTPDALRATQQMEQISQQIAELEGRGGQPEQSGGQPQQRPMTVEQYQLESQIANELQSATSPEERASIFMRYVNEDKMTLPDAMRQAKTWGPETVALIQSALARWNSTAETVSGPGAASSSVERIRTGGGLF